MWQLFIWCAIQIIGQLYVNWGPYLNIVRKVDVTIFMLIIMKLGSKEIVVQSHTNNYVVGMEFSLHLLPSTLTHATHSVCVE